MESQPEAKNLVKAVYKELSSKNFGVSFAASRDDTRGQHPALESLSSEGIQTEL